MEVDGAVSPESKGTLAQSAPDNRSRSPRRPLDGIAVTVKSAVQPPATG